MSVRFQAPPGWPAPPAPDWQPPESWRPPEDWPEPPPGWDFWVEDETVAGPVAPRRVSRAGIGAALAGSAVVVLGIGLAFGPDDPAPRTLVIDQATPSPSSPSSSVSPTHSASEATAEPTAATTSAPGTVRHPAAAQRPTRGAGGPARASTSHPTPTSPAASTPPSSTPPSLPPSAPPRVFFFTCAGARAAGVAPLHRGDPGYRPGLDGDHDGIACETPRRKKN